MKSLVLVAVAVSLVGCVQAAPNPPNIFEFASPAADGGAVGVDGSAVVADVDGGVAEERDASVIEHDAAVSADASVQDAAASDHDAATTDVDAGHHAGGHPVDCTKAGEWTSTGFPAACDQVLCGAAIDQDVNDSDSYDSSSRIHTMQWSYYDVGFDIGTSHTALFQICGWNVPNCETSALPSSASGYTMLTLASAADTVAPITLGVLMDNQSTPVSAGAYKDDVTATATLKAQSTCDLRGHTVVRVHNVMQQTVTLTGDTYVSTNVTRMNYAIHMSDTVEVRGY